MNKALMCFYLPLDSLVHIFIASSSFILEVKLRHIIILMSHSDTLHGTTSLVE